MINNAIILQLTNSMRMVKSSQKYYKTKILKLNKLKKSIEDKNFRNKLERLREIEEEIREKKKKLIERIEEDFHLENLVGLLLHRECNNLNKKKNSIKTISFENLQKDDV